MDQWSSLNAGYYFYGFKNKSSKEQRNLLLSVERRKKVKLIFCIYLWKFPSTCSPVKKWAVNTFLKADVLTGVCLHNAKEAWHQQGSYRSAHQSGMGYKSISKLFEVRCSTVRKMFHKCKTFKTAASFPSSGRLCKFTPKVRACNAQKSCKDPRSYAQTLQALACADSTGLR